MTGPAAWLGFELLRPGLLGWALLAAATILAAGVHRGWRSRRDVARLADAKFHARLFPEHAPARRRARVALATIAASMLGASLLGPVRGFSLVPLQRRGIDIVVALDTSRSMLAKDVDPDRLQRAKREISALFDRLEGERVGVVAFAGTAFDVTPLTRDLDTVRWFLDRLTPDDNRAGGTDLGEALRHSLRRLGELGDSTRAIVLVTDGEDLAGEGLEVASEAAGAGIKVHVLGMGTTGGAKIPDSRGRFVEDEEGREVVSKLEDATLRRIAEATGGVYMPAHGSVLPLERLYEEVIAKEQGRDVVDGKERIPRDHYQWPLLVALGCMLAELATRERKVAKG